MLTKIRKILLYSKHDLLFTAKLTYSVIFDVSVKANFYYENELIDHIKKGKSIIRFGDGETSLMLGEPIHFQKSDIFLASALREIVSKYEKTSPYILCVAERYILATNKELRKKGLFRCWITSKAYFNHLFNKNIKYGDAHMFYINGFFENKIYPIINNKKVIVVTKEADIVIKKPIMSKMFSNIAWVRAPEKDSYGSLSSILENVMTAVDNKENTTVLISTGPMGKVLAHNLSSIGIQSIDIGHGIVTLFQKDDQLEKVLV